MATMTALERTERVWDDILDLESSNRSGSPGRPKAATTDSMKNTTLLHRGDTTEIPMKGEEVRSHKRDTRRSATRESRGERARSLSRGLRRSLSNLRSRSKSAIRRTADKSKKKKKSNSSRRSADDVDQPRSYSDHPVREQSTEKKRHSPPERPPPDQHSFHDSGGKNDADGVSVSSENIDHDRGKAMMKLFERQQKELHLEMTASIASFDKEVKYWKKKAKALQAKGEAGDISERESGEKAKLLESQLEQITAEKEELKRKVTSSGQRTFVLEQQVKDRDATIEQLRNMMDKAEEDSAGRIELLERQLEKLVELKSRPDSLAASQQSGTASQISLSQSGLNSSQLSASQISYTSASQTVGENSHDSGDDSFEVKNLEALLVRVLAEKDKLAFENENLRSLVKQKETSPSNPVALANASTYQLSCRNCIDQSYVGQTKDNVKQKVRDHFSEVWYVARGMDVTVNTDEAFMKSSFAQHVAEHCMQCQSSEDVVRWCVKNIKVEKISRKFSSGEKEKGANPDF